MTPEQLAQIEARANAATPGPWRAMPTEDIDTDADIGESGATIVCEAGGLNTSGRHVWTVAGSTRTSRFGSAGDVNFIAHARTDIPALVARVRELAEQRAGDPVPGLEAEELRRRMEAHSRRAPAVSPATPSSASHRASHRWCLRGSPRPYVLSRESRSAARAEGRPRRGVYLHRLIMGSPDGLQIDHINGDEFDNRRSNLRVVTAGQNLQNQVRSDHRNVYRDLRTINGGWFVGITVNRKRMRSGCLPTREAAMEEAVRMRAELMTHVNEARHTILPAGAVE